MKAIMLREFGGPENLCVEDVPDCRPAAGEVVVRLKASALNHRDRWIRLGLYPNSSLPIILGSDGAGVVEQVGQGVSPSLLNQEVVINPSLDWGDDTAVQGKNFRILGLPDNGTYSECITVPATNVMAKPDHLSWTEAAALPLAGLTAYRAVMTRAKVKRGETVLVTGIGGGVAGFVLQFCRALGAKVLVTSGSNEKLAVARQWGAAEGVNYHDLDWVEQVIKLTDGVGPDVVIDSAGGASLAGAVKAVCPAGRIVFFGATTGLSPDLDLRKIFFRQLNIYGTTMGSPEEFSAMMRFTADHSLRPVIDRVFPLSEASAAHRRMDAGEQMGKIVLEV